MSQERTLRLGTRRSALARAQSAAVAHRLERLHPGLKIELVGIDTRGDQITHLPLNQLDGKEFFTAEIDSALLSGAVDFTVHSFKDLSLERPEALRLAAVPARENPRDILLCTPDILARLRAGAEIRIGSSSPRRIALVRPFLERMLPGGAARVTLVDLRGNVDTRLRRVREPRGTERHLDGVILAFAGLARLWLDEGGTGARALLTELIAGLPRMVLPLCACPTAPAQGALAIECRAGDERVEDLLASIDDAPTRLAVESERALLAARGGGCHQRFGATQIALPDLGALLYVREDGDGLAQSEVRWTPSVLPASPLAPVPWDGTREVPTAPQAIEGAQHAASRALGEVSAAFVTHRRALPPLPAAEANRPGPRLWVSGLTTWRALAERGLWVEGCAEGLGFAAIERLLAEPMLGLPPMAEWLVLTHQGAEGGWKQGRVLATYVPGTPAAAPAALRGASHVFWSSVSQFERYRALVAPTAHHASGPGKTADHLREVAAAAFTVFPSVAHWRAWLGS